MALLTWDPGFSLGALPLGGPALEPVPLGAEAACGVSSLSLEGPVEINLFPHLPDEGMVPCWAGW